MESRFKCCGKKFNNLYCITCENVFHRSCSERRNEITIINNHKIFCSKKCAENVELTEKDDQIETLNLIIQELKEELKSKETYIRNLKRSAEVFESDVLDMEQNYINEIDQQKNTIKHLQEKLENEYAKNTRETVSISTQTISCRTSVKYTQVDQTQQHNVGIQVQAIKSTSTIKNENIKTNTVEGNGDNKANTLILKKRNVRNFEINKEENSEINEANEIRTSVSREGKIEVIEKEHRAKMNVNISAQWKGKIKIKVVGDECAKNCSVIINSIFDKTKFHVEGLIKPECDFNNLTKNIFSTVLEYGHNDFIIVMFDTKNVNNSTHLKYALKNLLPLSKVTNLIIITQCNQPKDRSIVDLTKSQILAFHNSNRNTSLKFGPTSKRTSKLKLCNIICSKILYHMNNKPQSNIVLRTITFSDGINSDELHQTGKIIDLTKGITDTITTPDNFLGMPIKHLLIPPLIVY